MNIYPVYKDYIKKYKAFNNQVLWSSIVSDLDTPVSAYMKLCNEDNNSFLLESVEDGRSKGRYSIVGFNPDIIWKCNNNIVKINYEAQINPKKFLIVNENPFVSLRRIIKISKIKMPVNLPPISAGLIGYMGFDMIRFVEMLPPKKPTSLLLPESIFIRPQVMAIFDNIKNTITFVVPSWPNKNIAARDDYVYRKNLLIEAIASLKNSIAKTDPLTLNNTKRKIKIAPSSNTTKKRFFDMVSAAKKHIFSGDIFQVVLSQRFSIPFKIPPFSLYRSLRRLNPSPFLFYLTFGNNKSKFSIIGSSPEILVRLENKKVTIRPIAGTRPRGKNKKEDKFYENDLLSDPKELAEHLMLLDLGRNDVGKVSEVNTVKVTNKMMVEYYSHVMHIVSNVEGNINDASDSIDALLSGFPAGTVSGAPKVRALEIINDLEKDSRDIYAGCVGYFSANGNMETCIVLRTAIVKNKKMYVQAGAGIVADSIPQNEYDETKNKAKALFCAAEEALNLTVVKT